MSTGGCELVRDRTGDHVHATAWTRPVNPINPLTEVDTTRHQEGANYVFVDGHVKWQRFAQTFQPPAVNWWGPSR